MRGLFSYHADLGIEAPDILIFQNYISTKKIVDEPTYSRTSRKFKIIHDLTEGSKEVIIFVF